MLGQLLTPLQEALLKKERSVLNDLQLVLSRLPAEKADQAALKSSIHQLDDLFLIVVVGEFNSGKSALINALLGEKVLKEGVTPTTSRVHILKHGLAGSELKSTHLQEVRVENPVLKHLNIVDTPGTNAVLREHEAVTRDFVPRSDLILFVTSADRPFTETEREFLEVIQEWGKKVILVINKIDLLESLSDVEEVVQYATDLARDLLGRSCRVFSTSARQALHFKISGRNRLSFDLEANQFEALETHILHSLDEKEKLSLKFLNPVGVGEHLIRKYLKLLGTQNEVLQGDLSVLKKLDRQIAAYQQDQRKTFELRVAEMEKILSQFEARGVEFFDDRLRLARIFDLLRSKQLETDYHRIVVADVPRALEDRVTAFIDWMVSSEMRQWQTMIQQIEALKARSALQSESLSGSFESNRQSLIRSLGEQARTIAESFDTRAEAARLSETVRTAVTQTALAEAGAIGLGAAVTALATTTLADVTGLLAAGTLAALGLLVIPNRRRKAKAELRDKLTEVRRTLVARVTEQFEREQAGNLERLNGAVAPYSQFLRGEQESLEGFRSELETVRDQLAVLRVEAENQGWSEARRR